MRCTEEYPRSTGVCVVSDAVHQEQQTLDLLDGRLDKEVGDAETLERTAHCTDLVNINYFSVIRRGIP